MLGWSRMTGGAFANLKHATAALVAVGAIEPTVASAVVSDYGIAQAAREELVEFVLVKLARSERAASLRPPPGQRVVGLADQIELPEGTLRLRYATLDEHHTAVSAVYTPHGGRRYSGHGWLGRPPGLPPALSNAVLADDQGNTASLEFSGGGSDYRWELTLTADQPLATDTTWLELAGRRIRLLDRPSGLIVQIESLSDGRARASPSLAAGRAERRLPSGAWSRSVDRRVDRGRRARSRGSGDRTGPLGGRRRIRSRLGRVASRSRARRA